RRKGLSRYSSAPRSCTFLRSSSVSTPDSTITEEKRPRRSLCTDCSTAKPCISGEVRSSRRRGLLHTRQGCYKTTDAVPYKEETMAGVKTFAENEASGRLAEVYAEVMKHRLGGGRVPDVLKCMG